MTSLLVVATSFLIESSAAEMFDQALCVSSRFQFAKKAKQHHCPMRQRHWYKAPSESTIPGGLRSQRVRRVRASLRHLISRIALWAAHPPDPAEPGRAIVRVQGGTRTRCEITCVV